MLVLHDHHIPASVFCLRCSASPESILHTIRLCPHAQGVWNLVLPDCPLPVDSSDYLAWLESIFVPARSDSLLLCFITIWKIWHCRNSGLHDSTLSSFTAQAWDIFFYLSDLSVVPPSRQLSSHPSSRSWLPPPVDFIKINFDASFIPSALTGGCGGLARDSSGLVLAAFASPIACVTSALLAEAIAFRLAISFASNMGYSQVIFEGDNSVVINKMKSPSPDFSASGAIINDAKVSLIAFSSVDFSLVPRLVNVSADRFAKFGLSLLDTFYWFDNFPISF